MHKPISNEIQDALEYASHLQLMDEDAHHLAKSLLYYNYRNKLLEEIVSKTRHYLHSGLSSHDHTRLLRSIEHLDEELRDVKDGPTHFGLE